MLFRKTSDDCHVSDHLKKLTDEVISDFGLDRSCVKFATSNHLLTNTTGDALFKNAVVFLPDYLNATGFSQLKAKRINELLKERFDFEVKDDHIWATEDGKKIINSFLLSDPAKKFLIARDAQPLLRSTDVLANYAILAASLLAGMLLQKKYYQKMESMKKKPAFLFGSRSAPLQLLAFTVPITLVFGLALYLGWGVKRDRDSDALAITLGKKDSAGIKHMRADEHKTINLQYYLGALEFYQKVLSRNEAIYRLMRASPQEKSSLRSWLPALRENGGENTNEFSNNLPSDIRMANIRKWEHHE